VDSVGLEKANNVWGGEVRVLSGGAGGMSCDPNDDGTETILSVLAVGYETSCVDGGVTNLAIFQAVADLGCDSVPDEVKRRIEDPMGGLGRGVLKTARGLGEGIVEVVRAVEELRRVDGDTVVVCDLLLLRDIVLGDHSERWQLGARKGTLRTVATYVG
jgi:hypothetical protein